MTAFENDTIAAIATGPGESGISIVRIAGPRSLEVADLIFRCHGARPSGRAGGSFVHGYVTGNASADGRTEDIDEAILLIYRAPHSYTRENVVEIQGHGGTLSAKRILRRVLDCGVRSAEPGEFTKRAFLSGRIDLLQAEAVLDLIRARSDRAANAALEQLSGRLSASIVSIYDELLLIASDIEVSLDFSDDETSPISLASICRQLEVADGHLGELLSTWDEGHMLRDGVLTVISGRPNVGKSTLFNAMLGIDRAIVTEHPGTTRDTIEETLVLDGIPLRLVDTAGLRDTECDIEKEGIQRARYHIGKADFHVHVLDGSRPLDTADQEHIREMDPKNTILVMNKSDLGIQMNPQNMGDFAVIHTSLVSGEGVDKLKRTIAQRLQRYSSTPHAVISERHRQAMTLSRQYLSEATSLLMTNRDDTVVLAVSAVRRALETIGAINGRTYHDELLNQVFSRFCVGK